MAKDIVGFLKEHAEQLPVSFHMPGHKGKRFYAENGYGGFLDEIMNCDITEIPGADNLFQMESVILKTTEKYRRLYETKHSYLLINGSSGGIIAAILASVSVGGKLIMARNCHKSAFNALTLANIEPAYVFPETIEKYGILGAVSAGEIARCMDENPDAEAVILPSPNYYGICSDIGAIAAEVHKRGKVLIVDQAHGAHLKFFGKNTEMSFPKAAEEAGADIIINSIHKTLGSFTQTAVLNVCGDRIDQGVLEDKLQIIESSSPSYPLMATLDINADILMQNGDKLMRRWAENLAWFYDEASKVKGLTLMKTPDLDMSKLNIDMSAYGFDGDALEEYLMARGIFIELVSGNLIMCMSGIGNVRSDYEKLLAALAELAETHEFAAASPKQPMALSKKLKRERIPLKKECVHISEAAGRVCAASLIPYPPGIPIACPGEVLDEEVLAYVKQLRDAGEKVIGISADYKVTVGK